GAAGIRRIPVDDIPAGNQLEWSPTNKDPRDDADSEKARTKETAAGRAIVLRPKTLDVNHPIDVLLHLHGYTSRRWDPAAGWRQAKVPVTKDGKAYQPVRDVDQDRIEQQLATVTTSNPQTLGILPQGVGHSFFGPDFVPGAYINEVIMRLEQINELPKPTSGALQINLVLSAHSGGGHTVEKALRAEIDAPAKAAAAARAESRAAARAKRTGTSAPPTPPTPAPGSSSATSPATPSRVPAVINPVEVVLFEAINNPVELATVTEWVDLHLNRVKTALAGQTDPKERAMAIAACPILRAYRSRDASSDNVSRYNTRTEHIKAWFTRPAQGGGLPVADKDELHKRFKVEALEGVVNTKDLSSHEQVVAGLGTPEQGPLADALAARVDPGAAKLLKVAPPPPKAPKAP
ncbi:MAG TPA: hypothetical protein VII33_19230, partial [Nakamurella sp.]